MKVTQLNNYYLLTSIFLFTFLSFFPTFALSENISSETKIQIADYTLKDALSQGMIHGREMKKIQASYGRALADFRENCSDYTPQMRVFAADNEERSSILTKRLKNSGTLSAGYSDDGSSADNKSRSVTWVHPLFSNNSLQLDTAGLNLEIAALQRDSMVVDYRYSIIENYYEILRLQERVEVNKNAVERWNKLLEFATVRFDLGTSTKIDVLNAQVNLGQAENDVLREEQRLATLRDTISDIIGLEPSTHVKSIEPLKFTTANLQINSNWIIEKLEISKTRVKIARLETRDGMRNAKPDLEFRSAYSNIDGIDADLTNSLQFSFSLGRRSEEHRYKSLKESEKIARIDLEQDLASSVIAQKAALRAIKRLERSIKISKESVKQAEESAEFSRFSFEKGLVSAIELREAQTNVTTERSSLVNLKINYRIAIANYIRSMGGNLD